MDNLNVGRVKLIISVRTFIALLSEIAKVYFTNSSNLKEVSESTFFHFIGNRVELVYDKTVRFNCTRESTSL